MTEPQPSPSPSPLLAVGRSYFHDICFPLDCEQEIESLISSVIENSLTSESATQLCERLIGTSKPIVRLLKILSVSDEPIPAKTHFGRRRARKKTESWTEEEDQRLLAGIHRFGIDSWSSVAVFVGNSRRRSQCVQRWSRGLDPRISKAPWSDLEDAKLRGLIERFGTKSWTRVANELGNRSDVQCRYRFKQLMLSNSAESCGIEIQPQQRLMLPPIESLLALSGIRPQPTVKMLPVWSNQYGQITYAIPAVAGVSV
jgi:hypothetical protein